MSVANEWNNFIIKGAKDCDSFEWEFRKKGEKVRFARGTVAYLKPKIYPNVPRGVFGPDMVIDCVAATPPLCFAKIFGHGKIWYNIGHEKAYNLSRFCLFSVVRRRQARQTRA